MSKVNYIRFKKKGVGNDFGTVISEGLRNGVDQSSLLEQKETDIEGEMLGNVEP